MGFSSLLYASIVADVQQSFCCLGGGNGWCNSVTLSLNLCPFTSPRKSSRVQDQMSWSSWSVSVAIQVYLPKTAIPSHVHAIRLATRGPFCCFEFFSRSDSQRCENTLG